MGPGHCGCISDAHDPPRRLIANEVIQSRSSDADALICLVFGLPWLGRLFDPAKGGKGLRREVEEVRRHNLEGLPKQLR